MQADTPIPIPPAAFATLEATLRAISTEALEIERRATAAAAQLAALRSSGAGGGHDGEAP